jgi:RNA polymerase sigma-70 factor, ECF subfamily
MPGIETPRSAMPEADSSWMTPVQLLEAKSVDLVALDDALGGLAKLDPRQSRVVELRFFGGLSTDEISSVLGVSRDTVKRDWATAKIWLYREITRIA